MPSSQNTHDPAIPLRQRKPLPADGADGLYYQSWYPVALSNEVAAGAVIGRAFLGGKVAIFRTREGDVAVVSAFCPHLGADLSVGQVVDDNLRCAFHHWQYNAGGRCVRTGVGDPPPATARLFRFPTLERQGIIWAFNGVEPLFELPRYKKDGKSLVTRTFISETYACDGWAFACNTSDMQHLKAVHSFEFNHPDPHDLVSWHKWGFSYPLQAEHGLGPAIDWTVGITGCSVFMQEGLIDGWWLGALGGGSCPGDGTHQVYFSYSVEAGPEAEERLAYSHKLLVDTLAQDRDIINTMHFTPGTLTKSDKSLARFIEFLRGLPRAHPAVEFMS
jgi:nitrite reductase/ring-hydroxylating ferredoxin subunit